MRRTTLLTLLTLLFTLFLFSTWALGASQLFLEGMEAYLGEEYGQAVDRFYQVIELEGDLLFDSYYYKILSYLRLGDFRSAQRVHSEMQMQGYDSSLLYLEWGKYYMNVYGQFDQPDLEEAREVLEQAYEMGLRTWTLYSLLGSLYYNLGDLEDSLYYYQKALSRETNQASLHSSLARTYQDLGMVEEAIYHMEWSLSLDPDQSGLMVTLANIYYVEGDILDFIRIYRSAIQKDPNRFSFRQEYGIRLFELGFFIEALEELKEAVRLNPRTYLPYYYLGRIKEEEGAIQEALDYYSEAVRFNPDFTDALLAKADLLLEENPYRALSYYYQALEMSPGYAPVYFSLGRAYYLMGFFPQALDHILQALEIDPDHEESLDLLEELL